MSRRLQSFPTSLWAIGVPSIVAAAGCLPSIDNLDTGPLKDTFAVSDVFTPSGFMGDGATPAHIYMDVQSNCQLPRPANARGYCYTFNYYKDTTPTGVGWAGVFWVFPANNWGTRQGHAMDTTRFHQLRFSASVIYPQPQAAFAGMQLKGENPNYFYGNITGFQYQDSVGGKIFPAAPTTLTQYRIPFPDGQMTIENDSLIGGFGWSIAFPSWGDPASPMIIHLDDIVWDTAGPPAPGNP
jgi:hypothetical protein